MTLVELIPLAIKVSIVTLVFALGLKTHAGDLVFLSKRPWLLVRSLLSINLIMPVVATAIVLAFGLRSPVGLMIVALALAPLPPILPSKNDKAGGDAAYAISLTVTAALFALVSIPLSVEIAGRLLGLPLHIKFLPLITLLSVTVFLPLGLGAVVRRFLPAVAQKLSDPLSKIATVLLVVAAAAILFGARKGMIADIGDGVVAALALFIVAGLVIGHLLGGPAPDDRTVLAISTASRHPGIALAIIQMTFPDAKGVLPVLLLYLIANAIVGAPYMIWRKKRGGKRTPVEDPAPRAPG
jgi:BASS family bile acid:Na+ symporter